MPAGLACLDDTGQARWVVQRRMFDVPHQESCTMSEAPVPPERIVARTSSLGEGMTVARVLPTRVKRGAIF
jgi:hypothetical protein